MTARSAVTSTMTSQVIKNNLPVGSGFAEQMDPMELSSLNELLDRIAVLGSTMTSVLLSSWSWSYCTDMETFA